MIGQDFFVSMQVFFAAMPVLAYLAAGFVFTNGATGVHLTAGTLAAFTTLQMQHVISDRRAASYDRGGTILARAV